MPLTLVRVDDRLIHGQIMAVWAKARGADTIVIADDETAADEFLADILVYAAPPGMDVEVHSVADAAPRLQQLANGPTKAFALMKTPIVALELIRLGVPIDVLNIGGMGAGPQRASFYKNVSASPNEKEAMAELERQGTRVEIQIVADDKPVPVASILTQERSGNVH